MHIIYPRAVELFKTAKEMGLTEWRDQDCIRHIVVMAITRDVVIIACTKGSSCIDVTVNVWGHHVKWLLVLSHEVQPGHSAS